MTTPFSAIIQSSKSSRGGKEHSRKIKPQENKLVVHAAYELTNAEIYIQQKSPEKALNQIKKALAYYPYEAEALWTLEILTKHDKEAHTLLE